MVRPTLGSRTAKEHNITGCHYIPPASLQLPPQPLRRLLPILLLGEQRHNGCKQFDCYLTALSLRFEPGPYCAWFQHANHSATKPPFALLRMCEKLWLCFVLPLGVQSQNLEPVLEITSVLSSVITHLRWHGKFSNRCRKFSGFVSSLICYTHGGF